MSEVDRPSHSAEELLRLHDEIDARRPAEFKRLLIRGTAALMVGATALALGMLFLPDGFQGRSLGGLGVTLSVAGALLVAIGGVGLTRTLMRIKAYRALESELEAWSSAGLPEGLEADARRVPPG